MFSLLFLALWWQQLTNYALFLDLIPSFTSLRLSCMYFKWLLRWILFISLGVISCLDCWLCSLYCFQTLFAGFFSPWFLRPHLLCPCSPHPGPLLGLLSLADIGDTADLATEPESDLAQVFPGAFPTPPPSQICSFLDINEFSSAAFTVGGAPPQLLKWGWLSSPFTYGAFESCFYTGVRLLVASEYFWVGNLL